MRQSDYLVHYGVQGMRWGHRKDRKSSSSGSKKSGIKKVFSKTSKKIRSKKSTKNMTDQELQKSISRMELERRYKSLKRENVSSGRRIARDILKNSAQQVVTQLLVAGARAGIREATGFDIGNFKKK